MKQVLFSFSILIASASPALAQETIRTVVVEAPVEENRWTADLTVGAADGRSFRSQGFQLMNGQVWTFDGTICYEGNTCVSVSVIETERRAFDEKDGFVWHTFQVSEDCTLQLNGAHFWVPDLDGIWRARFAGACQMNDRWALTGHVEALEGGFVDRVAEMQLAYSHPVTDRFTITGRGGAAYSDAFSRASGLYSISGSYRLENWTASLTYESFANDDEKEGTLSVTINRRLSW